MTKRIANRDASWYVEKMEEFKGSNTFAEWKNKDIYVVYSYGYHWILYMNINGFWLGCNEKRNVSTSKQATQLRPNVKLTNTHTQKELQRIRDSYL